MKIFGFSLGQLGTNAYLLFKEGEKEAVLIDAPMDAAEVVPQFLRKHDLKLAAILLTHGHWDHIWDAAKLKEITGAKIYAAEDGKRLIEEPDFQNKYLPGASFEPAKIDEFIKDGQTLKIAKLKIKVLEAPGHCPGSVVFYVKEKDSGYLFAGDVIFEESVGRTDLWGGSFDVLKKSILDKIYTLPDDTAIFPGHGGATSVEREKKTNPFVRG